MPAPPVPVEEVLFEHAGPPQHVRLVKESDGNLALTIDDYWQFSGREERVFHEVLADAAMVVAPRAARVLILGGGDGLALRNVLRYREVESVTLVELDAAVVELARTVPEMVELTEDSFGDSRVSVVIDDARAWVARADPESRAAVPYDVIICDFPAPTSSELSPLFGRDFYATLAGRGHDDTVVSIQVSQNAPDFWATLSTVNEQFGHVRPLLAELMPGQAHDEAWADFILASRRRMAPCRGVADAAEFMSGARLEAIEIQNRGGRRFETAEYGDRPDFDAD